MNQKQQISFFFFLFYLFFFDMSKKSELVPLNLKIESSKEMSISNATSFLDKFLHDGVAIHAANNTVAAQLHQLHQDFIQSMESFLLSSTLGL
ncbi:uncharacterized protein B0P05DRAFT_636137 [Gilbertella persicaria]|uniref:uncharacterized protein n=1 Tax=Gilbertella persicaria TaxID=101096 RepID=UPI00221E8110|nr:uncharacterized protein B0P05DRAFT_636137 [Gilbertella persicaria]KAI8083951.1 hypothetical protein B0P05DRAFT_636137 [Gilbertella persicaria]